MIDHIAIPLWKEGRVVGHAKVDPQFHWLRQWKWRKSKYGYAMRAVSSRRSGKVVDNIWMHRIVTGCFSWLEIDHINRDPADNRLLNLRMVSHAENMRNKKVYKNNKSGHAGVSFDKRKSKWLAYFNIGGKRTYVGAFPTQAEAIMANQKARIEHNFSSVQ